MYQLMEALREEFGCLGIVIGSLIVGVVYALFFAPKIEYKPEPVIDPETGEPFEPLDP